MLVLMRMPRPLFIAKRITAAVNDYASRLGRKLHRVWDECDIRRLRRQAGACREWGLAMRCGWLQPARAGEST